MAPIKYLGSRSRRSRTRIRFRAVQTMMYRLAVNTEDTKDTKDESVFTRPSTYRGR